MTAPQVRTPVSGAAVGALIDAAQHGRIGFTLAEVAPAAGLDVTYLEAACHQLLVEHLFYDNTIRMTLRQVQILLPRLGAGGDLDDSTLIEAYLREQSRPEVLDRRLWAVK